MSNRSPLSQDRPTRRKLTPEQERELCEASRKGIRHEVLAVQFNVHFNTVRNVLRRCEVDVPGSDKRGD